MDGWHLHLLSTQETFYSFSTSASLVFQSCTAAFLLVGSLPAFGLLERTFVSTQAAWSCYYLCRRPPAFSYGGLQGAVCQCWVRRERSGQGQTPCRVDPPNPQEAASQLFLLHPITGADRLLVKKL